MKKSEKQAKEILDDLNYYDPGSTYYEDGVKRIAAMIEAAYPEMEAVGWCVFMEAVGWCVTDEGTKTIIYISNNELNVENRLVAYRTQGYTVEQVYRKILPAKIAKLEE